MYRKNLDSAFLAAASTPGAANALVTAAEQPIAEVAGVVQVKSGFGANGMKVGTDSVTVVRNTEAGFTVSNDAMVWSGGGWLYTATNTFNANTPNTTSTSPHIVTASGTYQTYYPWTAFDRNTGTRWTDYPITRPGNNYVRIDLLAPVKITSYSILGYPTNGAYSPKDWTLQASNAVNPSVEDWTVIDTRAGATFGTGLSDVYNIASPLLYSKYRIVITDNQGSTDQGLGFVELNFYSNDGAITTELVASGTISFSPSSLVLKDHAGATISTDVVDLCYSKNGAAFTSYITRAAFLGLPNSDFAGCTSLKIGVRPVGTQKVGSISITSISSGVIATKSGSVTISIDGFPVIDLQADGDGVFADLTADDITLTGKLTQFNTSLLLSPVSGSGSIFISGGALYFQGGSGTITMLGAN